MIPIRAKPDMPTALLLCASIQHCVPAITRRVEVPATISLLDLHIVLQILFDWQDCHLWQFSFGKVDYVGDDVDDVDDFAPASRESRGAYGVLLMDALEKRRTFLYNYDFGDDWQVDLKFERKIESTEAGVPVCTEGAHAGPVEDCGGPFGYMNLLEILANPNHPEREETLEWLDEDFDPAAFDLTAVNAELRDVFSPKPKRHRPKQPKPQ